MTNYKIIQDESLLIDFINNWLPDLEDNEQFYLSLFARKKYYPELIKSNDKTQLKRFLATKENMIDKIKQLELPLGRWKLKEIEAPQESLVLYILPNPRCMKKATQALGKKCWDLNRSTNYNLVAETMSCIQRSKSRSNFVDFDIDDKAVDLNLIKEVFWEEKYKGIPLYHILQTRGGYHLLVQPQLATLWRKSKSLNLNWHGEITKLFTIDQSGDQMIPVPGTIQGMFIPKFIEL